MKSGLLQGGVGVSEALLDFPAGATRHPRTPLNLKSVRDHGKTKLEEGPAHGNIIFDQAFHRDVTTALHVNATLFLNRTEPLARGHQKPLVKFATTSPEGGYIEPALASEIVVFGPQHPSHEAQATRQTA